MKYFYHPISPNCRKTTALLDFLDLKAERIVVDLPKGEQMKPEFLAVNPNGMVPTLSDGTTVVRESNVISIYLAEKAGSEIFPADSARRYRVMEWMFWEQSHFMFACGTVFFQRLIKPMLGQDVDEGKVEEGIKKFRRHAKVLNAVLEEDRYLVGDKLSLADWAVAGHLSFADKIGLPVGEFPAVERWLSLLDETPAWKAAAP